MTVYIVHPDMTGAGPPALDFYSACRDELEQHLEVSNVRSGVVARAAEFSPGDALLFFNRPDQNYDPALLALFGAAAEAKVEVFPVALTPESRVPPAALSDKQSFDVTEQLRQRNLTDSNTGTVAVVLARAVVSRLQPTLSSERMRLFISHRRLDGEELAAAFYNQLVVRAQECFRDLIDVRVGEEAQRVIEANLSQSDTVVFLDTPKAGESEWVARELEMALALNLPIVWVRLGPEEGRAPLRVRPAARPHFDFAGAAPSAEGLRPELADEVIHTAFRVSREAATRVFDQLRRLKSLAAEGKIQLTEEDRSRLLYTVRIPRKGLRYPERPLTHLIQFYGRWPKDDDESGFLPFVGQLGFPPHPRHGPPYDTALLVAPIPGQAIEGSQQRPFYADSMDEYVSTVEKCVAAATAPPPKRGLIISGAFPDAEPEFQQNLTAAVHAFVRATLDRQGIVIFGAHPTFTPLVFDMARRRRPRDFKSAVRVYVSRHFVDDAALSVYERNATVFATEEVGGRRDASLSRMRREMIADGQAAGLVAIGGKTKAGGHAPGVDEEIALAREAGLPVFLVGSAGGRASELGAEMSAAGWADTPNGLTAEQNQELFVSPDYGTLANMVLEELKL
jgi:hypothetical protein